MQRHLLALVFGLTTTVACSDSATSPRFASGTSRHYVGDAGCDYAGCPGIDPNPVGTGGGSSQPPGVTLSAMCAPEDESDPACSAIPSATGLSIFTSISSRGTVVGKASATMFGSRLKAGISVDASKEGQSWTKAAQYSEYEFLAPIVQFLESPQVELETGQTCGAVARGTGYFSAATVLFTKHLTIRSYETTKQSPSAMQLLCPGEQSTQDVPAAGTGGGLSAPESDTCYDRYFWLDGNWNFMYTWCV